MGSNHVEFKSGSKIYKLISGVSNPREQPGIASTAMRLGRGVYASSSFNCGIGVRQWYSCVETDPLCGAALRGQCQNAPRLLKLDADRAMIAAQHVRLDEGAFETRGQPGAA